jgi:hypothetical protein
MDVADFGLPPRVLLLDYDSAFTRSFDAVFKAADCDVKRVGLRVTPGGTFQSSNTVSRCAPTFSAQA